MKPKTMRDVEVKRFVWRHWGAEPCRVNGALPRLLCRCWTWFVPNWEQGYHYRQIMKLEPRQIRAILDDGRREYYEVVDAERAVDGFFFFLIEGVHGDNESHFDTAAMGMVGGVIQGHQKNAA